MPFDYDFSEDDLLLNSTSGFDTHSFLFTPRQKQKIQEHVQEISTALKVRSIDAIKASQDFIHFRLWVCGQPTYPYMLKWIDELNTGKDNKFLRGIAGDDVCILAPRNSAKSTLVLQWVAWVIGRHVEVGISLKILYISYIVSVAAGKSKQIQAIIETSRYQETFPLVKKSRFKWGAQEWCIDLEFAGLPTIEEPYTLSCAGLKGGVNSKRAHLLIYDDLLKDPKVARNKKLQDDMLENYHSVFRYTGHEGARQINLGTRMAKFDIYATAFIPVNGWRIIKQSALLTDADGKEFSYCEDRTTLETLQKERELELESFLLQRQNELPEETSLSIREHHIKWSWLPVKFERIVIGLDTADSTEDNTNATAAVIVGIANDCLYIIDGFEGRIQGNLKKIELIYDFWHRRKGDTRYNSILAHDHTRHTKNLAGDWESFMEDIEEDPDLDPDFRTVTVEKVSAGGRGEKIDRMLSHSYLYEKGRILFNQACTSTSEIDNKPVLKKLVTEMVDHNPLDHNDLMDALEVAIFVARQHISGELSMVG